jgi:hypothetical protein
LEKSLRLSRFNASPGNQALDKEMKNYGWMGFSETIILSLQI